MCCLAEGDTLKTSWCKIHVSTVGSRSLGRQVVLKTNEFKNCLDGFMHFFHKYMQRKMYVDETYERSHSAVKNAISSDAVIFEDHGHVPRMERIFLAVEQYDRVAHAMNWLPKRYSEQKISFNHVNDWVYKHVIEST